MSLPLITEPQRDERTFRPSSLPAKKLPPQPAAYCCRELPALTPKGSGSMQVELLLHELDAKHARSRGPANMNLLEEAQQCNLESCADTAKFILGGKSFCLEYFIAACYERLDELDPRIRGKRDETTNLDHLRDLVEECSNQALLVSLRCESLNNLNRSRLLDILLWSSDLLFLLSISLREFALLTAFRLDSEPIAPLETAPPRPPKPPQFQGKRMQNG